MPDPARRSGFPRPAAAASTHGHVARPLRPRRAAVRVVATLRGHLARPLRPRRAAARVVAIAVVAAAAGAVVLAQPAFMRNMHTGPVVLPGDDPRAPAEDTIPVDGQQPRDRLESRDLPNPVPDTPAVRAEGEWLYEVYCAVCHGPAGLGDGQIAGHYPRMPSLAARHVRNNYTDGWIFSIIGDGGFRMPPFAHSMSIDERWALVRYVRTFTGPDAP